MTDVACWMCRLYGGEGGRERERQTGRQTDRERERKMGGMQVPACKPRLLCLC